MGAETAPRLPSLTVQVVEDACAVIALRDSQRREPPRRHPRTRHRWHVEGRRLRARKARVKDVAVRCLDSPG
ncbi:hypothetical protein [Streptomyces sp. NBC_01451]|uniref:hypothetical protein n=1 Tax=Streptomyces sp. NBC_01451 TaxID=2903872 RepID=UPI002E370951|nr:hypothetical protein [Streptomyces sp. NBC_01451]